MHHLPEEMQLSSTSKAQAAVTLFNNEYFCYPITAICVMEITNGELQLCWYSCLKALLVLIIKLNRLNIKLKGQ